MSGLRAIFHVSMSQSNMVLQFSYVPVVDYPFDDTVSFFDIFRTFCFGHVECVRLLDLAYRLLMTH